MKNLQNLLLERFIQRLNLGNYTKDYRNNLKMKIYREIANEIIEKLENEKDLENSVNEYQKLLKLNNLIEKKFHTTNKEISEDTKSKIKTIISQKNEKKIK